MRIGKILFNRVYESIKRYCSGLFIKTAKPLSEGYDSENTVGFCESPEKGSEDDTREIPVVENLEALSEHN